jgi:NitT/TauT family transport system substrate-binding protein
MILIRWRDQSIDDLQGGAMKRFPLGFIVLFALAACAPLQAGMTPTEAPEPTLAVESTKATLTDVTVAMGYIPNIQFAPFFIAEKKGYFSAEGLKVKYDWGFEVDGVKLVGASQIDFAIAGGDQILQARAQGIPIVYVANWYNAFPIEIVSLKDKNIAAPKDLVGKKVGMPCLCGATYTAWRSLLYTQKVDPANVNVQDIGFTQVQALTQGTVDAVGVYANNEPVQLKLAGKEINEIKTWDYTQLVGNGVATNEDTVQKRPDLVRRFVRALLKGISDSIADPNAGLQISVAALPEAGGKNLQTSEAVLKASIPLWTNSRLGATRPEDWQAMEKFMREAGFIQSDVDVTKAFTNEFVQ